LEIARNKLEDLAAREGTVESEKLAGWVLSSGSEDARVENMSERNKKANTGKGYRSRWGD
jgi:hypothetical protein